MPVYEQSYRHYSGTYLPRSIVWSLIARRGIHRIWQGRIFWIILIFCLTPFLYNICVIYLEANLEFLENLGGGRDFNEFARWLKNYLTIDAEFYYNFLYIQLSFCYLIALVTGADIISSDKRCKALTLYLAKPMSKVDYLFGKGSVILFYLYSITLFPTLLLMFFYAFFNDQWNYLFTSLSLILKIFLYCNVVTIPLVMLVLAISSLTKSRVGSATMICVAYLIPPAMVGILQEMTRQQPFMNEGLLSLFTFQHLWTQMGSVIFYSEMTYDLHWSWHLGMLILICAVSAFILHRQIRAVEVVK